MNLFEVNKFVGALLATGLVIFMINEVGDWLMPSSSLEQSVYVVATEEAEAEPGPEPEAEAEPEPASIAALIASADLEAGRKTAKKCAACHSFDKGGRNKVGPNLWDIVGGDKGAIEGYRYSKALMALGGTWGYEDLDGFLANPKAYLSGTKMAFKGIAKPDDRANLILFMRSFSDSPLALPAGE